MSDCAPLIQPTKVCSLDAVIATSILLQAIHAHPCASKRIKELNK